MALYSKPVRLLMKDMAAELAAEPGSSFSKNEAISWFTKNYPNVKPATVGAHLIRLSTNASSRTHYSAKPSEDDVLYQIDGSHFRLYRSDQDPEPIRAPEQAEDAEELDDDADIEQSPRAGEFAYEKDLKNYLARNLRSLEPGLQLYDEEGITGLEFPVGGRFIDILATDKAAVL